MKKRIMIAMLALTAMGAGAALADRTDEAAVGRPLVSSVTKTPTPTAPALSSKAGKPGYIEGSVTYPGEAVPTDTRVCAIDLAASHETCTRRFIRHGRFKGGRGYRLTVPPGNYQVYAIVPSFDPGYQAFYSAFVVCGYRAGCTDHSPITVVVTAGKVRADIEPGDFYDL